MNQDQLKLGEKAKHKITEFSGIVDAICEWRNGQRQVSLLSPELHAGKPVTHWFDESDVVRISPD